MRRCASCSRRGRTDLLTDFVSSRTRRKFKAFLVRDANGKVGFEFEPRPARAAKDKGAGSRERRTGDRRANEGWGEEGRAAKKAGAKKAGAKKAGAKKAAAQEGHAEEGWGEVGIAKRRRVRKRRRRLTRGVSRRSYSPVVDMQLADWVFGYGSLIWNPEIDFDHAVLARVHGYHRAFCIRSTRYRGTPSRPGVVLGLDRGGSCVGVAMRLNHPKRRESIARLYDREMLNSVYTPSLVAVTLRNGAQIRALSFVADRSSPAYERLSEMQIVARLRDSSGRRGANRDYAINTLHALQERGVHDARLARLVHRLLSGNLID